MISIMVIFLLRGSPSFQQVPGFRFKYLAHIGSRSAQGARIFKLSGMLRPATTAGSGQEKNRRSLFEDASLDGRPSRIVKSHECGRLEKEYLHLSIPADVESEISPKEPSQSLTQSSRGGESAKQSQASKDCESGPCGCGHPAGPRPSSLSLSAEDAPTADCCVGTGVTAHCPFLQPQQLKRCLCNVLQSLSKLPMETCTYRSIGTVCSNILLCIMALCLMVPHCALLAAHQG